MPDQPLDSELSLRGIIGVGAVLVIVTAVVTALMWWMSLELRDSMRADDPAPSALPEARAQQAPAGPLLQADPIGDLDRMRQEEDAILEHAGWVDQASAVARLPIETALDVVAGQGELPSLDSAPAAPEDGL